MRWAGKWVLIRIISAGYWIVRTVLHYLLAVTYWSRNHKVPSVRDPILQMSATELANQIRERKLTSECVVRTYVDRILEVEPFINATVDRRFNDALQEARAADVLVASGTMSRQQLALDKPLLGVPFTVKVLLTVKGLRCTGSSYQFQDVRGNEDARAVALMKKAGAIVIATTNSAECGINFETNNYAHGTTCNPYDTSRTSGGSSGGESALVAAAGSVIGLGNDLAGSIRLPCMFCGLFGHKPSRASGKVQSQLGQVGLATATRCSVHGLVSNEGCFPSPPDKLDEMISTGPMCRYATDLVTTMKILANPSSKSNLFGQEVDFEGLKIYYIFSLAGNPLVSKPDPEIKNSVKKVISYFETKHGSETKLLNLPLLKLSNNIYIHKLISSVPDIMETLTAGRKRVDGTIELLKLLLRQSKFTAGVVVAMNAHSIPLIYNANNVEFYDKLGKELEKQFDDILDDRSVLVMPTFPFAAPYHNEIPLLVPNTCYTHIFNVLGFPGTQCPIGFNKQGLPIGVQVLSRKGNDHLTMACAVELEKAFGGWIPPS